MWTNESIDSIAMKHFPNINREATLKRPILYSNWLSKDYMPVEQERLREYVQARLKVRTSLALCVYDNCELNYYDNCCGRGCCQFVTYTMCFHIARNICIIYYLYVGTVAFSW